MTRRKPENVIAKRGEDTSEVDPRQLELPIGARTRAHTSEERAAASEREEPSRVPPSADPRPPMTGVSSGPEGARASMIVGSLPELSSEDVFAAFEELDSLPADVVRAALSAVTGPAPDPERLDDATRRAHGFPARRLRLRTVSLVKDADLFDLGDVAEEQLRIAGKSWDGLELAAEERLDGESEGSFAGTLEHRALTDADQPGSAPLFDVLRYAEEAGAIFRAGTTELVGAIADGKVEMKDRRARTAIEEALAEPFEPAEAEEALPPTEDLSREEEPAAAAEEHVSLAEEPEVPLHAAEEEAPAKEEPPRPAPKKKTVAAPKKKAATASKTNKKAAAEAPKNAAPEGPKKAAAEGPRKTAAEAPKKKAASAPKAAATPKANKKAAAEGSKKKAAAAPKGAAAPKASKKAAADGPKKKAAAPKAKKAAAEAPKKKTGAKKASAKE